jgi:GT2 family glycosyltransferase
VTESRDIAVAIATRDRPAQLARCVDAILDGALTPVEIVIVDQGSTPDAAHRLAEYVRRGIALAHILQRPLGLSAARNAALRAASASLLAITDDDCVPSHEWLLGLARVLDESPEVVAVTGPVLPLGPEEEGKPLSSRSGRSPRAFRRGAVPWVVGTGGNFGCRREAILAVGGYDERLGAGTEGGAGEDVDLLHRLLRGGQQIRYEPSALVYHARVSAERRRATRDSYGRGIGACCVLWFFEKDAAAPILLARWLALRTRRALKAVLVGHWRRVAEEVEVVRGTARGLAYGVKVARQATASGRR